MKKIFIVTIVFALIFGVCSCNSSKDYNREECLNMILEIDNDLCNTEKDFNHKNIVSDKVEYSTDDNAPLKIKCKINDHEEELDYHDTLYYPIGGKKVNRYFVNGNEDHVILISQDGSVNSILYEFITLDISKTATPNEVLPVLERELNKWINTSDYEHINIPEYSNENIQGFGIYDFLYYNSVDGYMTDYVKVSVSDDGCVFGFSINNLKYDNIRLDIDKELEIEMLNLKLKDIYTTDNTKYKSYNTVFTPQVVIYNDKPCIRYFVSADYSHATNGDTTSWLNSILIPVDLITAK